MRLIQGLLAVVVLWLLSMVTLWVLRDWGPIEAVFRYAGDNAIMETGSFLAALIIMILVLTYAFGRIMSAIGAGKYVSNLLSLGNLFSGR